MTDAPADDLRQTDPNDPRISPHRLTAESALRLAADGVVRLLDIRKAPAREASARGLARVDWLDPRRIGPAAAPISDPRPLALFCVHGHEVSQNACETLRNSGRLAYFVVGGFEALAAAGADLAPLADARPDRVGGGDGDRRPMDERGDQR